jgi:hypothetical protein
MEKISSNMACTKTHAKMSKSSETRAAEDGDVVALQTRRIWSEIVSSFQVLTACTRKTYCTKVQLSAPPWPAQADDGSEDPPINLFSSQSQTRAETSWTTDLQRTRIDPNSKPVPPPPRLPTSAPVLAHTAIVNRDSKPYARSRRGTISRSRLRARRARSGRLRMRARTKRWTRIRSAREVVWTGGRVVV